MLTATGDVHNYMQQCDLIKTSTDDDCLAVTGAEFYINFFWYRWMWMSPEIDLWSSYNNIISTVKSIIIPTPFSITDTRQLIRIICLSLLATNYIIYYYDDEESSRDSSPIEGQSIDRSMALFKFPSSLRNRWPTCVWRTTRRSAKCCLRSFSTIAMSLRVFHLVI